jgi:hypothetical protein
MRTEFSGWQHELVLKDVQIFGGHCNSLRMRNTENAITIGVARLIRTPRIIHACHRALP